MSTTPARTGVSVRSTATASKPAPKKVAASVRSAPAHTLCAFTFANGHHCRMPRRQGHPCLCFFHARKEAHALAAENAGEDIAGFLSGAYITACDLNSALGRLFVAVAQGHIKSKTAATLAYLGQTLAQTLHLAQDEYINAFGTDSWRRTVRSSFPPPAALTPAPPAQASAGADAPRFSAPVSPALMDAPASPASSAAAAQSSVGRTARGTCVSLPAQPALSASAGPTPAVRNQRDYCSPCAPTPPRPCP